MKRIVLALLTLTTALQAFGGEPPLRVPGKAVLLAPKSIHSAPAFRMDSFPSSLVSSARLAPMMRPAALAAANEAIDEKRVQVGVRRELAEAAAVEGSLTAPRWLPAPGGGHIARFAITSPQAGSLRLGLVVRALPQGSELRFAGSAQDERMADPVAGPDAVAATRNHG